MLPEPAVILRARASRGHEIGQYANLIVNTVFLERKKQLNFNILYVL